MPIPGLAFDAVSAGFVTATQFSLDRTLTPDELALIQRDVDAAVAAHPDRTGRVSILIAEMAALSRKAAHPATRSLAADITRQLFVTALPSGDAAASVRLLDEADPMAQEFQPGLGLARSDIHAVVWLEATHAALPDVDPDAVAPDADATPDRTDALLAEFAAAPPPNRHFMSRLDAWAAGVRASWTDLTPRERDEATAVTLRRDVPSPDLVRKVTGGGEVVAWLGVIDISLTDAERAAYPNVMAFLDAGGGAAGVTDILNQRLRSMGGGAGLADANAVNMLRDMTQFYWNNGIASGLDAGGAMLGLD